MIEFIVRRLVFLVFVILGITVITFFLINLAPGDPAVSILQQRGVEPSPEAVRLVREIMGFDDPFLVRYWRWLTGVLQGNFGQSYRTGQGVFEELLYRLPATIELTLAALFIALAIAIPVGVLAAVKHNTVIDHLSRVVALVFASIPNYWLGLLLIYLFAVYLGWLPVAGRGGFSHLVLPAFTLAAGIAAILTRLMRSDMLEILHQNYVRTARAKGLQERQVLLLHALKNAILPVVTVVGLYMAHLLGGTVIIETVFAWPGMGKYVVDSIFFRDYPVVQGFVFIMAIITVTSNLIVDISYHWLDPRLTFEAWEK